MPKQVKETNKTETLLSEINTKMGYFAKFLWYTIMAYLLGALMCAFGLGFMATEFDGLILLGLLFVLFGVGLAVTMFILSLVSLRRATKNIGCIE